MIKLFYIGLLICCCFPFIQAQQIHPKDQIRMPTTSVISDTFKNLAEELAYVRNEIFARHGRSFKNSKYKTFFSHFGWYKVNPNYNDTLLSEKDIKDISILKRYENVLPKLTATERNFLKEVLITIKQFRYRTLDTTIMTMGDVDGDLVNDTIQTRIYEKSGTILIKYCWKQRGKLIWEYSFKNPYFYIGDSELYQFDKRDSWIVFTTALKHCVFRLEKKEDYNHINVNLIASIGVEYLKKIGYVISLEDYKSYLQNFSGHLVCYHQREDGCNLDIWYKPANQFIPFYRP